MIAKSIRLMIAAGLLGGAYYNIKNGSWIVGGVCVALSILLIVAIATHQFEDKEKKI
jgi:hypothetical protein